LEFHGRRPAIPGKKPHHRAGFFIGFALVLALFAFGQTSPNKTPVPRFEDVAKQVGLTVSHISSPDKRYIVESMSGGVGLIDCDNDGKLDIITVNGSTVDRYKQGGDPMITLYHHDDGFKFTDITKAAGLTRNGWGMGVAVADYDEIRKEMKLALMECGRKLGTYLRKRQKMQREAARRDVFERYIGEIARAVHAINGTNTEKLYDALLAEARKRTAIADAKLDEEGRTVRHDETEEPKQDQVAVMVESRAAHLEQQHHQDAAHLSAESRGDVVPLNGKRGRAWHVHARNPHVA